MKEIKSKCNRALSLIKWLVYFGLFIIEEPLMQEIRYLDKLVDELAKGKSMEKILRTE